MIALTPVQAAALKSWFLPDQPGPLVGLHVLNSGHGRFLADRWPDPRALLVETGSNYALVGDPRVLQPDDLLGQISGFVAAPEMLLPLLRAAFPDLQTWERVFLSREQADPPPLPPAFTPRCLTPAPALSLDPEIAWIAKTWGGFAGLAESGKAWAIADGRLIVAVACPFFLGERYEDIGVATSTAHQDRGLGTACAAALCRDILARGRRPSWTTSFANLPSLRLARRLGFAVRGSGKLYVINTPIPQAPEPRR